MTNIGQTVFVYHIIGFIGNSPKFLGFLAYSKGFEGELVRRQREWHAKGYTHVQAFEPNHPFAKAV